MGSRSFSVISLMLLLLSAKPAAAAGPLGRSAQFPQNVSSSSENLTQPKSGTVPSAFLDTLYYYAGAAAKTAEQGVHRTSLPPAGKGWYLKSNVLTYCLLVPNLAVEWEMGTNWSGSVPVYHSGWDWFRVFNKFRVFGLQPELRYFFRNDFSGFFVGAHATLAWYNIAIGEDYRYQDHSTTSPSLGAGVSFGYRMPMSDGVPGQMHRWYVEFSVGGGFLPLHYDMFYNVENGAMAQEGLRKTYWGIDQVSISFLYRFGRRAEP